MSTQNIQLPLMWCRGRGKLGDYNYGGCIRESKGHFTKETLYQSGGVFYLRIVCGTKTPRWKFWCSIKENWTVTYRFLSEDEAREWIRRNLPSEPCFDEETRFDIRVTS